MEYNIQEDQVKREENICDYINEVYPNGYRWYDISIHEENSIQCRDIN